MTKRHKKDSSERRAKKTTLSLSFSELNSGINKIVVGAYQHSRIFNGKARSPFINAKAIDINFNHKSSTDNPYTIRVEAIEQLLHKARNGDDITIYTTDPYMLALPKANNPDIPPETLERFNKLAEHKEITVMEPKPDDHDEMEIAVRMAKLKMNALSNPSQGTKGYHR